MRLSELAAKVGDENIAIQNLGDALIDIKTDKNGDSKITFGTNQITAGEIYNKISKKVCLIVWLPHDKVQEAIKQ